jgi:DNA polymerase elongation subunit (family B)
MAQIAKTKKTVVKSFKLFDFNSYDDVAQGDDSDSGSDADGKRNNYKDNKTFVIQMFGVNERGETCCIYVNDYKPFFFVKVGDNWSEFDKRQFIDDLKTKVGARFQESIVSSQLVEYNKLYGFSGGRKHKFIKLVFQNSAAMNKYKNLWFAYDNSQGDNQRKRTNLIFKHMQIELYESNIPPLLRYFHINNISPSGWISFKLNRAIKLPSKTTTCNFEYILSVDDLIPLPEKETMVPYKICSFDIEASSSHGDFPVPIKTYKRFATNLVDVFIKQSAFLDEDKSKVLLRRCILTAFGYDKFDDIDLVYPKSPMQKDAILKRVDILYNKTIESAKTIAEENNSHLLLIDTMFEEMRENMQQQHSGGLDAENEENDDSGDDEEENRYYPKYTKKSKVDKKATILSILMGNLHDREEKIQLTNEVMTILFPQLEGDKVTFIGSTFLKYGEAEPYMNHCIALGTCDQIDGAIIESVTNEKDLLMKWAELIQKENPDIMIGYNIFGFDYEFMFRRSLENSCENEFLALSRNKGEFCGTRDYKTGKIGIKESSIVIASGQHDLRYIDMTGRLQVDLYNYFRRDFNLTSYKLDYCAGYFIGDGVKKIEHLPSGNTKVTSSNLMGLENGNYIHFEESSHSTDMYKEGEKFKVLNVNPEERSFEIEGHEMPDMTKSVRWGLAKDDVTPQDIFRMTNEGPKERAVIAKYCIQDCNLVHHLMNKIDVMTGYIEMSKICSVPISFLVLRGQSIKLTSFIAKKCREKRTLMPVIERSFGNESYEGAICLPPKCNLYLDNPVACLDYSSLYPSSMISENLSHDSKVWTKEFDLAGQLVRETGVKDISGNYIYDNLSGYEYVDVTYDAYKWVPNSRGKAVKTLNGKKICRFAQPRDGVKAIMPDVLEELLAARKATRKLAEATEDPFMANILDKRQLGYKVTANSLYGQCGAKTSTFYDVDIAASTTATGRKLLTYGKRIVEEVYGDAKVESKKFGFVNTKAEYIYGDSVANYTPIYVRENGQQINIIQIDELAKRYGDENGWVYSKEQGKEGKEYCEMIPSMNIETWSDKGWTKLHRIIRHRLAPHKKMIRVLTHTGLVDVTDDHSLVDINGNEISPKDVVKNKTELLHFEHDTYKHPENIRINVGKKIIVPISQYNAALKWDELNKFHGHTLSLDYTIENGLSNYIIKVAKNTEIDTRTNASTNNNIVKKIHEIPYPENEFVYDLTTENHHFAAGVGNMIVHNTDSVFFTFNLATPDGAPIRGKDALEITIEFAKEVGHLATRFLKQPHAWVYEKTLMPFCLLSKKRYIGMLYEDKPEKPKRKSMGIVLKRRDNAPIVKDIYGGVIDILMKEQNVETAIQFLKSSLQNLVDEKVPMDKLIISKSLRSGYKNPAQIAHKVLADRMGKRDQGNKPSVGDRIPFVYIQNPDKKALQGERIEHPDYILANKIKPNYAFYITNQIMKPLQQVFALVLENIPSYKRHVPALQRSIESWNDKLLDGEDEEKIKKKITDLRNKEVKKILFDEYLIEIDNASKKNQSIMNFFKKK